MDTAISGMNSMADGVAYVFVCYASAMGERLCNESPGLKKNKLEARCQRSTQLELSDLLNKLEVKDLYIYVPSLQFTLDVTKFICLNLQ